MAIWTPQHTPSYQQGFARCAAEAENPGLWKGLVGLWAPTLGPTGLTLRDWSGYGNHGTLTNMDPATDYVPSEKGWALDYDGDDDFIELGTIGISHPLYFRKTTPFSISFELFQVAGGDQFQRIVDKSTAGSGEGGYAIITQYLGAEGHLNTYIDGTDVATFTWTGCYSYNTWASITWTYGGVAPWTSKLFANGRELHSINREPNDTPASCGMRIGSWNHDTGRELKGRLRNICIHGRVLALSEAQHLHADPHAILRPRSRVYAAAGAPAAGHPTMRRWGGIPHMGSEPVLAGRSW